MAQHGRIEARLQGPASQAAGMRPQALEILDGNLRVVVGLLAGASTLGVFTLLELLWNAFQLGFGLSALARGTPGAVPLALRYVPLEFSAFVLAAVAAQHVAFTVLRCLATGERPRFMPATVALATALGLLATAAIVEARVAKLVAALGG